jgi:hypothetical protein
MARYNPGMTHISGHHRSQTLLLTEAIDDYVGPDNEMLCGAHLLVTITDMPNEMAAQAIHRDAVLLRRRAERRARRDDVVNPCAIRVLTHRTL